ncbi:MAG: SDR family oxidoreductase [Gammaproteobacteria bacterium]|nr:SDR family oxidoreductase [Gammaproteobacteria bacterium]
MDNLVNSKALVTGATKGIGLAVTKMLLKDGVEVNALGRDFSRFSENTLADFVGDSLQQIQCDLSNLQALEKALTTLPRDIGLLVLNAGFGRFGGLEQFSFAQIKEVVDTNLVSNLYLLKHYLPLMKANGGGDIVLVGSESALQGAKAGSVYCASKFAIRGLAQSIRAECANSNIRVNLVNPGPTDSQFFDQLNFAPMQGRDFVLDPEDVQQAIYAALQQPRHVVTEEINLQPMKRSFQKNKAR